MNVSVDFNASKAISDRVALLKKRQKALDIQVVKDSNYFCPEASGDLKKSALTSKFGSGEVRWNSIYAREQYYGKPNKSKDKNPNARMKWFEEAKALHKKKWLEIANG